MQKLAKAGKYTKIAIAISKSDRQRKHYSNLNSIPLVIEVLK